ncbi:hypothetical protein NSQ93_04390 [Bacillus sp. FSL W8-0445]|uniref:hypothetical protein n=1 Tax=Bacillus TaxID=1386 RepID=UPI000779B146|nr:hypothetical protein [Bacillus licheniformis]KYC82629.1 hypothetical protein B4091_1473 [Bacillus licheniformis]MBS2764026.1 hypothetical protein [Bacillus licheniformis]MBU8800382.1 hypothetical protein [Bacillus licheniformis]MCM3377575.1 hypothetical protein [Bacillus licheniformis]MCM3465485.1 hypothetical protein [Bacillus licheniformis]
MKKFLVLFLSLGLALALAACGSTDDVSTGADNSKDKKTEEKKDDGSKKVDASSQKTDALGMKVNLGDVKIMKDKVNVGLNIENTTDKVLNFYPDQGNAVVGDMQLSANMFLTDGEVGGEVQGGVKQDGVLEFAVPEGKELDINNIKEIKLNFGDVTTEDFMNNKAVSFTVPVK